MGQRMARKQARNSPTNSSGCSKAAKCPPRSSSFQCTSRVKRFSAQRREVVPLASGRVLAAGPTSDVLTADNVKRLYDVEADVQLNSETGHMTVVPVRRIPR